MRWPAAPVLIVLCLAGPSSAATRTWTGATNHDFSVASNWQDGIAPVNGDDLVFPPGAVLYTPNSDMLGLAVASLTLDGLYSLTGNDLVIGAGGIHKTGLSTSTIDVTVVLEGATPVVVDGGILDLKGVVSGPGGLSKSGAGRLGLWAANSYLGETVVLEAFVYAHHPNALGATSSGTTIASGAALSVATLGAEPLTLNGSGYAGYGALVALGGGSVAGPLTIATNAVVDGVAGTLILSGAVSGPGSLSLGEAGTKILTADSPAYAGEIVVKKGTVLLDGDLSSTAVSFGSAASMTLGGSGIVGNVLGGPNVSSVAPGPVGNAGVLTTGNLMLKGTLSLDLLGTAAGNQYDQVVVNGTASVAWTALSLNVGFTPALGDQFTIVQNDGADAVVGTFTGLPEGATFAAGGRTFQITYAGGTGNDIVLTVVSLTPVTLTRFDAE